MTYKLFNKFATLKYYLEKCKSGFERYPVATNAATGFLTFAAGDVISQKIDQKIAPGEHMVIDLHRSLQVGCLGIVMNGFFLPHWYRILDKFVGTSMVNRLVVWGKVVADQVIFAPFAIVSFFAHSMMVKSRTMPPKPSSLKAKMNDSFATTYLVDCAVWPVANYVNFRWVPITFRPAFTAFTQLAWQSFLSYMSNKKTAQAVAKLH